MAIEPDVICKNDPAYWACLLVLAIKRNDQPKVQAARRNLKRLGFDVVIAGESRGTESPESLADAMEG